MKLSNADPQVSLIELVWNVPTQGTKCSPFLNDGVEETQAIEHLFELSLKESVITKDKNSAVYQSTVVRQNYSQINLGAKVAPVYKRATLCSKHLPVCYRL